METSRFYRVAATSSLAWLWLGCAQQVPQTRQRPEDVFPENRNLMMRTPISVDPAPAVPKEPTQAARTADRWSMSGDARSLDRKTIDGRRDFVAKSRVRLAELEAKAERLRGGAMPVSYVDEHAWKIYESRRAELMTSLPTLDDVANSNWRETSQRVTTALNTLDETLKRIESGR